MIKKDLKRAGIPCTRPKRGTADSHAVGRHTHITELLRNGASLAEACELARHSDIRMTMQYTHIGLDDQARAVALIRLRAQRVVFANIMLDCPSQTLHRLARYGLIGCGGRGRRLVMLVKDIELGCDRMAERHQAESGIVAP
jgi:hypothetical protein